MSTITPFSDSELWTVRTTLRERYGRELEPEQVETELRLDRSSSELSPCPALYWTDGECNFLIAKTGDRRYRCNFFYRVHQVYGTGIEEYDDLAECTVTLLQVQADHAAGRGDGSD